MKLQKYQMWKPVAVRRSKKCYKLSRASHVTWCRELNISKVRLFTTRSVWIQRESRMAQKYVSYYYIATVSTYAYIVSIS